MLLDELWKLNEKGNDGRQKRQVLRRQRTGSQRKLLWVPHDRPRADAEA